MDQHYLKNLSIECLLGTAGFNAQQWNMYQIPRCRGTRLWDAHTQILIEFFFPNLYYLCERAKAAHEGFPMDDGDAQSETNFRFLTNLREMTFFWLQDAIQLFKECPRITSVPPWSTLLQAAYINPSLKMALEIFGAAVNKSLSEHQLAEQTGLLSQIQLQERVQAGTIHTAHLLENRLSMLPKQVGATVDDINRDQQQGIYSNIATVVENAIHDFLRRVVVPPPKKRTREQQNSVHSSQSREEGTPRSAHSARRTSLSFDDQDAAGLAFHMHTVTLSLFVPTTMLPQDAAVDAAFHDVMVV